MYLLFWLGMAGMSVFAMFHFGTEYVDYPKLCKTNE